MYTLRCDNCLEITPGGNDDMRSTARAARGHALRYYGWVRRRGQDLCNTCKAAAPPTEPPPEGATMTA